MTADTDNTCTYCGTEVSGHTDDCAYHLRIEITELKCQIAVLEAVAKTADQLMIATTRSG